MSARANKSAVLLLSLVLVVAFTGVVQTAQAQNRLSVEAGGLFPFGDLGDATDTSLYIGARFEFQDINALGAVAVVSYLLRAGYAPMRVNDDTKSALEQAGESTDSNMFNAGGGLRVYSTKTPVFLSLGLEYLNLDPPGMVDSQNGMNVNLGAGLTWGRETFVVEAEVRGHLGFFSDIDNIQYMTLQGEIGVPF
jgi:hypothetical protein